MLNLYSLLLCFLSRSSTWWLRRTTWTARMSARWCTHLGRASLWRWDSHIFYFPFCRTSHYWFVHMSPLSLRAPCICIFLFLLLQMGKRQLVVAYFALLGQPVDATVLRDVEQVSGGVSIYSLGPHVIRQNIIQPLSCVFTLRSSGTRSRPSTERSASGLQRCWLSYLFVFSGPSCVEIRSLAFACCDFLLLNERKVDFLSPAANDSKLRMRSIFISGVVLASILGKRYRREWRPYHIDTL